MFIRWTKKLAISIVGFTVLAIGIILIPLPGPGLLVCALGLAILTLEYEWANNHLAKVKTELNKIIERSKSSKPKD
jgi:uncharacterized protein (TIGR02611 family)